VAVSTIAIRVQVNGATVAQNQFKDLEVTVTGFGKAFEGVSRRSIASGEAMGHALYDAFRGLASTILSTGLAAIKYSQQFNNAMIALGNVATHVGSSAAEATKAAKELSADGLLPLRDSAKGLQNLMMTGFGLQDSIKIMRVFKDSAAFSRQEMYSFGDAVRTATEGLRNSRSVQVDNVGITKNLSQIMKEAGFQLQDLADKTKGASARQALLNGLMREAAAQAGDAAKALQTYTGAVTAIQTAYISLLATWGDAITTNKSLQIALTSAAEALRSVTTASADNKTALLFVSDVVTLVIKALAGALRALDSFVTGLAVLNSAVAGVVKDIATAVRELTDLEIGALRIAMKLPGVSTALAMGYGEAIATLIAVNSKAKQIETQAKQDIATQGDIARGFSARVKPLITALDDVSAQTDAWRGYTVQLGNAAKKAGEDTAEGFEKGRKKVKQTIDTFRELLETIVKMPPVPTRGLLEPGNLDPFRKYAMGTAVPPERRTMTIEIEGRTLLLSTISDTGKLLTNMEALAEFRKSGKHLGIFADVDAAEAAAAAIAAQQRAFEGMTGAASGASKADALFAAGIARLLPQLPKFEHGMEATRDAWFGFKEIKAAYEAASAIGEVGDVALLTAEKQAELHTIVGKGIDVYRSFGIAADKYLTDVYNASAELPEEMEQVRRQLAAIASDIDKIFGGGVEPGFEIKIKQFPIEAMFGGSRGLAAGAGFEKALINATIKADKAAKSMRDAFVNVFLELPNLLTNALASTASKGEIFASLGRAAGNIFAESYQKHVALALKENRNLTKQEKALGLTAAGVGGFFGGFDIGAQRGKAVGAFGGAATGAMSGFAMGGPVGAAVGGIAGFFGGLFGGAKKAREERKALEENKKALLEQYGGMQKLQKLAQDLGIDISKAFDAKNAKQFEAAVNDLNKALELQKQRLEALGTAVEGINERTAVFREKFQALFEKTKIPEDIEAPKKGKKPSKEYEKAAKDAAKAQKELAALALSSQAEFERLGFIVSDTFQGLVRETGSGIEAMQQMAPAFQLIEDGVSKFGLTSTAVIEELRANFKLVNDTRFKPFFDAIVADGKVLSGLFDAKALSPEGFQSIAADIGHNIQGIIDKGGDMKKTLALSQPVLQKLWEAQKAYGTITDKTTQKILKQAEEQGIVGDHMKDVNQKILDVLLAIGEVLGAKIPEYLNGLKGPADQAGKDIEDAFNRVKVPEYRVHWRWEEDKDSKAPRPPNMPKPPKVPPPPQSPSPPDDPRRRDPRTPRFPGYAAGGLITRPTLALVGERGAELILPLTGARQLGVGPAKYETTILLDGTEIARSTARRIPKLMRTLGVGH
jgi:hypothetical protein